MISLIQIWYGSDVRRQGRSRWCRRNQASSRAVSDRFHEPPGKGDGNASCADFAMSYRAALMDSIGDQRFEQVPDSRWQAVVPTILG